MANDRQRYTPFAGDEKQGLDAILLNIGEISVVFYSLEVKNQIIIHFQYSDTHMIIDHTTENSVSEDGMTKEDSKFEMIFSAFKKDDYYCHVLEAFATYEDAEVSEAEYLENTKFDLIEDLRTIIASNVKIFLLHVITNHDIVLNQYLKAGEIGHSEGKDILTTYFDLDIKQDEKVDYIKFRNNDDRELVIEQRQDYVPYHDVSSQDDDKRNEAKDE